MPCRPPDLTPCTTRRASEAPQTRRPNASLDSALVRFSGWFIRAGQLMDSKCSCPVSGKRQTDALALISQHKGCVKIGWAPNRNSCGTTRKRRVPPHTRDEVKWHRSSVGLTYDVHTNSSG